jgi:hypothetical protein
MPAIPCMRQPMSQPARDSSSSFPMGALQRPRAAINLCSHHNRVPLPLPAGRECRSARPSRRSIRAVCSEILRGGSSSLPPRAKRVVGRVDASNASVGVGGVSSHRPWSATPHPGLRFASAFPPHRFAGGGIRKEAHRASHSATSFCDSARASASPPRWPCSGRVASELAEAACSGRLMRSNP